MTGPSSTPRGERPGRPGARWNTELVWSGEQVTADGAPECATEDGECPPAPNRATRRAARRRRR
ncbi:hypothetical protein [Streptomyces sp. NPDC059786]|uniref:hypothetical protein n=1 Tax=Streptomyces sp. NPDC059786 TaxID=3346946 RepID=UPI00365DF1AB